MLRLPLTWASPAGTRGRLSILIFHRVLARPDPLFPETPTARQFREQMLWLKAWFNVLPLDAAINQLFTRTIPSRALAISFDDGYGDNQEVAAPILQSLGLRATFFIATGFLSGGSMWNDQVIEAIRAAPADDIDLGDLGLGRCSLRNDAQRRQAIDSVLSRIKHLDPRRRAQTVRLVQQAAGTEGRATRMMTPDQVRQLRAMDMGIGAHTVSHPILARVDDAAARAEISQSKRELEDILRQRVSLFAYPNGQPDKDYSAQHAAMARDSGFDAAVSTAWGSASLGSDRFQLPRFTPWDKVRWRYGARLLVNLRRRERIAR